MGNKYVIVLTACINPGKMIHTSLTDVDIRRRQYEDALEFYLLQTDYPIVFVENSGTDISGDFRKFVDCGRLEFVTFQGNEEFDRKKGKGYGEALILEYALEHSLFVHQCDFLVKITGRLKLLNVNSMIGFHRYILPHCDIQSEMDRRERYSDSRMLITGKGFLQYSFLARKERIDDSKGCNFEHILFTSIDEQKDFVFYPFLIRPLWRGISGTNGREYWEGNYISLKLAYFKRMLNCMTEYNMCHPHNKPSMGVRLVLGMAGMAVGTVLRFFDWIKNE